MASNYSVYGAKFNPFTYEELVTPVMQMTQDYRDMQDKYSALMAQAEAWQDKANEENNPYAHAIYTNYINDLKLAADDLSRTGLNEANRSKLLSFYPRYAKEIMPIENAYTKWNQVMEEHRKMQMQDPTFRASYGDTPPNIDMYLANPELQFNTTSGNTMRKEVSDRAKNFALHNPAAWREILDGRLLQGIQSGLYSVDDIYDIINGDEQARKENPELVNLVDTVVNEYMQGDWSEEDRRWGWQYAAQGLYDALTDREYNYYNNPGYVPDAPEEEPVRVRREANVFSSPSGVYGNAEEYSYAKDARYATPEEAAMLGLPIVLKDMQGLSDEDKKVLNEYYDLQKDEKLSSIYESLPDMYKNELKSVISETPSVFNFDYFSTKDKILGQFSEEDYKLLKSISGVDGQTFYMDNDTTDKILNNPTDYNDAIKAFALMTKFYENKVNAFNKLSRKGRKVVKEDLYNKVEKMIDDYSYLYPGNDDASKRKAFNFGVSFEQDQAKQNTTRYLLSNDNTQKEKAKDFMGSIIKGIDKDQLNDKNNAEFGFFDEDEKKLKDVDLFKDDSDMWKSFDIYVSNKPGQEGFVFAINGKHYQLRGSNEINEANYDMMMFNTIASDFSKDSIIGKDGKGKVIPDNNGTIASHIEEELSYEDGISHLNPEVQRVMLDNMNPVFDDKGNKTGYYRVVLHDMSENNQGLPDNYYVYIFKENGRGGYDYLGKNNLYAEMHDGEERSDQLSLLANDLLTNLTRNATKKVEQ